MIMKFVKTELFLWESGQLTKLELLSFPRPEIDGFKFIAPPGLQFKNILNLEFIFALPDGEGPPVVSNYALRYHKKRSFRVMRVGSISYAPDGATAVISGMIDAYAKLSSKARGFHKTIGSSTPTATPAKGTI